MPKKAIKKTVSKKTVKSKTNSNDLSEIFNSIKSLMEKYIPPFKAVGSTGSKYELCSMKEVLIMGRKYNRMYFTSIIIQSNYVGFYYMPIYAEPAVIGKLLKPELLKTLKGKSCFHIKKNEPELFQQIEQALKIGADAYKKRGWV
jgi:hypothetical protein